MELAAAEETKLTIVPDTTDTAEANPPVAETAEAPSKVKAAKAYDSLDSVVLAMSEQDEQLRAMKTQLQDMIAAGSALKKAVKQLVQDAAKDDSIEIELSQAKKKLATMKNFLNTV